MREGRRGERGEEGERGKEGERVRGNCLLGKKGFVTARRKERIKKRRRGRRKTKYMKEEMAKGHMEQRKNQIKE